MLAKSEVPEDLIAAYRATEFRCGAGAEAFTLRIGVRSDALVQQFASTGCTSAVFITAYTPFSQPQSEEANRAAQVRLGDELASLGRPVLDGVGADPKGRWPPEPSYLVLGVLLEAAQALGRRYQQNALVWVGADAVPELMLLR